MLCWSLEPTCANDFGSPFSGTPGDKRISGDQVTQGALGGLRDADARGDDYAVDTIAVIDDAEIGARAGQDLSVVALACDSQGFRQAAGAGGDFLARRKSLDFGPYFYLDASRLRHPLEACHWLQSAEQDASGHAVGKAGDIQAVVIAVDEVDLGAAGRAEENSVARRLPCRGVCSRIVLP